MGAIYIRLRAYMSSVIMRTRIPGVLVGGAPQFRYMCLATPIMNLYINMAAISLSDLLQAVGVSEKQLDDPVSDDHLRQMSLFLTSWMRLAPFLEMGEADTEAIGEEGGDKRLKMLQRWKSKNAFKATYRKLVDALLSLGMADLAEKVCKLLQPVATSNGGRQPDAVEIVHQLREACSQAPPSPEKRLELLQQMQSLSTELLQSFREENEALKRKNETLQTENSARVEALKALQMELSTRNTEMDTLRKETETLRTEYSARVEMLVAELSTKTKEMGTLKRTNETLQTERREQDSVISSLRDEIERMRSEVENGPRRAKVPRLSVHQRAASSESPPGLTPQTRLQWRRGNEAPVKVGPSRAVMIEERVYVQPNFHHEVYQYDWKRMTWSVLPDCPVKHCGMVQFLGKLTTVGGQDRLNFDTGKVYQFNAQQWEESLPPMTTARSSPTVVTKPPAIAACGGRITDSKYDMVVVSTVEVYSHASSHGQWHTAQPLPLPCAEMTSATIGDTCYLLGGYGRGFQGIRCCYCVFVDALIDSTSSPSDDPIWAQVSDIPLYRSTAAVLRGSLIAIGGYTTTAGPNDPIDIIDVASKAIHVLTSDGSWERVKGGDLPEPCSRPSAVCLPSGELMVIGGDVRPFIRKNTAFIVD